MKNVFFILLFLLFNNIYLFFNPFSWISNNINYTKKINEVNISSNILNDIKDISKNIIEKSSNIKDLRLSKNKFYKNFFNYLKNEIKIKNENDLTDILSNIFNEDKSEHKAIYFKIINILENLDKIDEKNLIFLQYHIKQTMPLYSSLYFAYGHKHGGKYYDNKYQEQYNKFWGNDKQFNNYITSPEIIHNSQQKLQTNIIINKEIQEKIDLEKQAEENETNHIKEVSRDYKINLILNIILFNKNIYNLFYKEYIFEENNVRKLKKFIEFLYSKYYKITESNSEIQYSSDENRFDLIYRYFLSIYKNKIKEFSGDYFLKLITTTTINKEELYKSYDDYYENNKEDGFITIVKNKIISDSRFTEIMDSQEQYLKYTKIIKENIISIKNHLINNSDNNIEIYFKIINNNITNLNNVKYFIRYNRNNYLNNLNNKIKELQLLSSSKDNIVLTERKINQTFNKNLNEIDEKDVEILLKRLKQNIDQYKKYCFILKDDNSKKYISILRKKIIDYKKKFDDIIVKKNIESHNYTKNKNIILSALTFIGLGSLYNFENNFLIYKKQNPKKGRFSYLKDILFNKNKKINNKEDSNNIIKEIIKTK